MEPGRLRAGEKAFEVTSSARIFWLMGENHCGKNASKCSSIVMRAGPTTILGFGSLLSEQSARTTFPDLDRFRLVRVHDYRRVFAHAGGIFSRTRCSSASLPVK